MATSSVTLDGTTTEYTVNFALVNSGDLTIDIDGVVVSSGDYTVDGHGLNQNSFRVTFTTAPTPAAGTMTFTRKATVERVTNFSQTTNWTSTALNAELDNFVNIMNDFEGTAMQHNALDTTWDAESKTIINVESSLTGNDSAAATIEDLQNADNVNSIPEQTNHPNQFLQTNGTTYDWAAPASSEVTYDNTVSGLTATDAKAALDEVFATPLKDKIATRTMSNSGSGTGGNTYTQEANLTTLTGGNPIDVTATGTVGTSQGIFRSDIATWTSGTDIDGNSDSTAISTTDYIPLGIASSAGSNCIATVRISGGNYVGLNMYSNAQGSQTTTVYFLKIT
jgi:hypothetical protein